MPDFLDVKRREIDARLQELKPLCDEYARLEAAAAALAAIGAATPATKDNGRKARPAAAATATAVTARRSDANGKQRGRPKGSGPRAKEALQVVTASPGITVSEIAEKSGITQNYLYRVLRQLADDGLVTKDGHSWHPKVAA